MSIFIYCASYDEWYEKTNILAENKDCIKTFFFLDLKQITTLIPDFRESKWFMTWSMTWKDGLFKFSSSLNSDRIETLTNG